MSIDIYRYLWMSIDIYRHARMSTDIYRCCWMSIDICTYVWMSMGCLVQLLVHVGISDEYGVCILGLPHNLRLSKPWRHLRDRRADTLEPAHVIGQRLRPSGGSRLRSMPTAIAAAEHADGDRGCGACRRRSRLRSMPTAIAPSGHADGDRAFGACRRRSRLRGMPTAIAASGHADGDRGRETTVQPPSRRPPSNGPFGIGRGIPGGSPSACPGT